MKPEELTKGFIGKEGPGLKNPIYAAQLEATDRAVGRVLSELDNLDIAKNTLVIFTSDNGGWSGATDNRPLRKGKGYLYEGGLRVPLIMRWPGRTQAGTTNSTPVISMDLTATILDAVKASPPTRIRVKLLSPKSFLTASPSYLYLMVIPSLDPTSFSTIPILHSIKIIAPAQQYEVDPTN